MHKNTIENVIDGVKIIRHHTLNKIIKKNYYAAEAAISAGACEQWWNFDQWRHRKVLAKGNSP